MNIEGGYLGFYWQDRAQTLGEHLNFCSSFFEALGDGIAQLSDVRLATAGGNVAAKMPITDQDLIELGRKIMSPSVKYNFQGGDSNFLIAKSPLGYTSTWVFDFASTERGMVTISSGSYGDSSPGNSIVLKLSGWESLMSQDDLERVWINLIICSKCDLSVFTSKELNKEIDPDFQYDFAVGWLSYVVKYDGLELNKLPTGIVANFAANGLVLKVSKEKLCSFDEAVLSELHGVQELLVDSGVVGADDF